MVEIRILNSRTTSFPAGSVATVSDDRALRWIARRWAVLASTPTGEVPAPVAIAEVEVELSPVVAEVSEPSTDNDELPVAVSPRPRGRPPKRGPH